MGLTHSKLNIKVPLSLWEGDGCKSQGGKWGGWMKAKGIGVKGSRTWDEDHSCFKVQVREVTHMFAFWRGVGVCVCVELSSRPHK
jgi:hypothetical protein